MRLIQLEYNDREAGWHLLPTEFSPNLTLLVGISGVGKTRILQAVRTLRQLARAKGDRQKLWGLGWSLRFAVGGLEYVWEGEFESRLEHDQNMIDQLADEVKPRIVKERLATGERLIVERDSDEMRFESRLMPKLSPYESAISIFQEENVLEQVGKGFGRIAYLDQTDTPDTIFHLRLDNLFKKLQTLEQIREADLPTYIKLAVAHANHPPTFQKILQLYQESFPHVEDLRFSLESNYPFPDSFRLSIRENGVDRWIPQSRLSSGMYSTLMHIGSILLWPDESVMLIDEVENGLGMNCLDNVTNDMMTQSRRLQFLVTAHHPYIINAIPPANWKVVSRVGGEVRTRDASELGIGKSRHDAFIQLINSPEYTEGIVTP